MIKTFYKQIKNPSFDIPTWGLKINSDNKTINENIFFDYATINNLYIEKPEIKFKQLLSSISLNTGNIGLIKSVVGNFQFNNYMKDIKKTYDLRDELGWQMEKTRGKARRELNAIDIQLINNYNLQQAKKDNREVI